MSTTSGLVELGQEAERILEEHEDMLMENRERETGIENPEAEEPGERIFGSLVPKSSLGRVFSDKTKSYWSTREGKAEADSYAGIVEQKPQPAGSLGAELQQAMWSPQLGRKKSLDLSALPSSWADESESEEHAEDTEAAEETTVRFEAQPPDERSKSPPIPASLLSPPEKRSELAEKPVDVISQSGLLERMQTLELRVTELERALNTTRSSATNAASRAAAAEAVLAQLRDECVARLRTLDADFLRVVDGAARYLSEKEKQPASSLSEAETKALKEAIALKDELKQIPEVQFPKSGSSKDRGGTGLGRGKALKFKGGKWV